MIEMKKGIGLEEHKLLPEGWQWVQLGDVCDLNPRRPPLSHAANAPTTFVPMSAVEEAGRGISQPECKPFSEVRSGYTYFIEGDVLFAKITPCMQNGKHAIAQNLIDGFGFGSTEFHVIRPKTEVTSEWIHWFILQPSILRRAESYFTGTVGQQRVPQSYLEALVIPLPALSEQRRIVEIVAKQMEAVERAREATKVQLETAKILPAAYLRGVFESDEAQQWPKKHIGEIVQVQSGYAFRSEWFALEGIRLLRNVNILQGYVNWNDKVYLPLSRLDEFKSYELTIGDIVLSLDRPVVSNGLKIAQLTSDDMPSLLLQRVARFRLLEGIDRNYLYAFLNSTTFISAITKHDQSLGVPHVSPNQVAAVSIPLPPLVEQRHIAAILNKQLAKVEQARAALEVQLTSIKALPATLLFQAFNGAL